MKTILKFLILFLLTAGISYSQNGDKKKEVSQMPTSTERKDDELSAEEIIERNKNALVSIWYYTEGYYDYYTYTTKDTTLLSGSGFIFDNRGFVGTNNHVVDGFDSLFVKLSNGIFYNAEVIFTDPNNDIAIIKIIASEGTNFPVVKIGNSDNVKVGQNVYAIGSPLGFEYTISEGIVAAIRENEKVSFNDPNTYAMVEKVFDKVIQITAAISPGNSGGALFNGKGEVIGITTYSYGFYGNLNFATAINSFLRLKNSIDFASIDTNEDFLKKKKENLFSANLRLADSYKMKAINNWYYSRIADTMKTIDSFTVIQDSINKANLIKAEQYYYQCIEMKPDSFYVYSSMMDLYVSTDRFSKAEELYKTIRERFDSDSLLNTLSSSLASAYSTSKDYDKAIMFYEKMLKTDTSDNFIRYQIANLYELKKDYRKAANRYKSLIKRDPEYAQAYIRLGKIYYEKGDYEEAKKYLNTALEKSLEADVSYTPFYLDLHYYIGLIAVKEGKKLQAMMAYFDMKSIYTYTKEENEKKLILYKSIKKMED